MEQARRDMGVDRRWKRRAVGALTLTLLVSALVDCTSTRVGHATVATPSLSSSGSEAASPPSPASTAAAQSTAMFPADRVTTWNPGVPGGVPARSTICAHLSAAAYGNGARDATAGIQAAIKSCPAGQVVLLSAGTFTLNDGNFLLIDKGITLRGAGPGQTTLQKTDGAKPGVAATGPKPSPIVILGPSRWANSNNGFGSSTNLTVDAVKGAYSITVASASGFKVGQTVLLDELSGAAWQTDPCGRGQIWAAPDFRVVWQLHHPAQSTDDPLKVPASAANQDAFGWFSRLDRPTAEIKQINSIAGNVINFSTPIHISYRASHMAQLSGYVSRIESAGIESLTVSGGDNGNIRFQWCDACWAKSIDNTMWHDEGFSVDFSFRVEIRDSYVHDAAWAQPGGGGYAISLSHGASEVLVENSIVLRANKVMVARSAGAGSVFGYNYVDDGYINTSAGWIEVGLNGSHMVGSHHMLFEGNYGFNFDSDKTHGNAVYHTIFRNYLTGLRAPFNNQLGGALIDDANQPKNGPRRAAGAQAYSYWYTFVGNVLGQPGKMSDWTYQATHGMAGFPMIWLLGWDDWPPYPTDSNVAATALRHGNYDYVTNTVVWDPNISDHALPASLYLTQKPAFFNAGHGYTWPWVDPVGTTKVYVLPAMARYDAGTPFVQP